MSSSNEDSLENEVYYILETNRKKIRKKYKRCSVPGCDTKDNKMCSFPRNDKIRRTQWSAACRINRSVKKFDYACRKHFKLDDFCFKGGRYRLKPGTVPTQNLPQEDCVVDEKTVKISMRHCTVISCKKTIKDGITLHYFPRNITLREKWLALCNMRKGSRRTLICSDHFQDEDFCFGEKRVKVLKRGVMPTRNLPISSERSFSEERYFSDISESTELQIALQSISNPSDSLCSGEFICCDEYDENGIGIDKDATTIVNCAIKKLEALTSVSEEESDGLESKSAYPFLNAVLQRLKDFAMDSDVPEPLTITSQGTKNDQATICDKEIQTDEASVCDKEIQTEGNGSRGPNRFILLRKE